MTDFEYFEQIMSEGAVDVDCTECGYGARVEPDCDDECPEPGCRGRLTSPLITAGLI